MSFVRRLIDFLDISNIQEVLLVGVLPEGGCLDSIAERSGKFSFLGSSSKLSQCLPNGKPRVIVTLVGLGTERGFLIPPTRELLSERWWQVDGYEVGLFAYSCYSAEYLDRAGLMSFFSGALCYRGELWFSAEDGDFWVSFIERARSLIKDVGRIGSEAYGILQEEYSRQIRGRHGHGEVYLAQISLVAQSEQLKLIRGRIL